MNERGPLDNMNFEGDRYLQEAAKEQLDGLFEGNVVETILKHYGVQKVMGIRWCRERHGEDAPLLCECLPELVPQCLQRFTTVRLKLDTKRVTTLSYDWLEKSLVGESVSAYGADQDPNWIVTDIPVMPGPVVIGKRSFPLETCFTGYVSSGPDKECYVLCNLRQFLQSQYCKPR